MAVVYVFYQIGSDFGFFFAVGNVPVPESTGMPGRSKTSHVRSWGDRSGRGCPTRTASVGYPHQLEGGHVQSGWSAMGTDTGGAVDGRKEATGGEKW
jgi:hypothetical protein